MLIVLHIASIRGCIDQMKDSVEAISEDNKELNAKLDSLECQFSLKIDELQQKSEVLSTEIEPLKSVICLEEIESGTISAKSGHNFLDGVRQCCIELLSMNVASKQIYRACHQISP